MSDYSKELVASKSHYNKLSVGDKVKLTNFYLTNYAAMNYLKDVEATIVDIKIRYSKIEGIEKADRQMYIDMYGVMDLYPIVGLKVQYPDNKTYVGSPFGFSK